MQECFCYQNDLILGHGKSLHVLVESCVCVLGSCSEQDVIEMVDCL